MTRQSHDLQLQHGSCTLKVSPAKNQTFSKNSLEIDTVDRRWWSLLSTQASSPLCGDKTEPQQHEFDTPSSRHWARQTHSSYHQEACFLLSWRSSHGAFLYMKWWGLFTWDRGWRSMGLWEQALRRWELTLRCSGRRFLPGRCWGDTPSSHTLPWGGRGGNPALPETHAVHFQCISISVITENVFSHSQLSAFS